MTDVQWKRFYDTMSSLGLYPKGLDYNKAYDLSFHARHLAEFSVTLLSLSQVGKRFASTQKEGGTQALDDLSFAVPAGEFVSFLGTQRLRQIDRPRLAAGLLEPMPALSAYPRRQAGNLLLCFKNLP